MKAVLIIFMVLAGVVSIFSLVVVIRDIVREKKNAKQAEPVAEPKPIEAVPVVPEVLPQEVAAAEPQTEADENAVVFSAEDRQKTLDEKFRELDEQRQRYYVEIVQYAMSRNGAKQFKNQRYEEYKIGKTRLVRLQIRRDSVMCEFLLLNPDFNNYIRDNKLRVRQSPTVLRVEDEATVEIVKNGIDIAVKAAEEEIEYKKQLQRERRKKARLREEVQSDNVG